MAADAKLEVVLSAKNLAKKGFDDFEMQAKKTAAEVNGTFTKMGNVIRSTIGGIAVGAIAAGWVREINAAGDAYFKMSQTFQGRTNEMVAAAKGMAEDFKHFYSFNDIAYAFTKTADSMERYGVTGEKYLNLVTRAADIGAAKNIELKESIDRIESAIRGEAEASEYLGLTLNDTYMKNQAFGGSLKDTWEKLTDNEKALHRYNELMQQSSKYTGSTAAAVDTLGGAWNRFINTIRDNGNDALVQQNSLLATSLNLITDLVDAMGNHNARVAELIDTVERGLEKPGNRPRSHKMPPPPPGGYGGTPRPVAPDWFMGMPGPGVVGTVKPSKTGGGRAAKGPTGPSGSHLEYVQYQGAQLAPDWFAGMPEAGARAQAILDEVTETATVSFEDISVSEQTWLDGAKTGLEEYHTMATDTFNNVADAFGAGMSTMEDFLVDFVTTGKLNFKDLVSSILEDLARLMIRQTITGPIASALSAGLSGAFGGGGWNPGGPGMDAAGNTIPRPFASGGIASGPTSGYGATLHGTEAIIPLSGGRGVPVEMKGGGTQVIINNNTSEKAAVSQSTNSDGIRQIMVAIGNDIRKMGPVGQSIGSRFGLAARGAA